MVEDMHAQRSKEMFSRKRTQMCLHKSSKKVNEKQMAADISSTKPNKIYVTQRKKRGEHWTNGINSNKQDRDRTREKKDGKK